MTRIKKAYNYIFYKFYRMFEAGPTVWWSEYKAAFVVDLLLLFILLSFSTYIRIFINPTLDLFAAEAESIIILLVLYGFNHYKFIYKDKWKNIVDEFDQLSKSTNKKGTWYVFFIVILIIANLCFPFYLMTQIDWSHYR